MAVPDWIWFVFIFAFGCCIGSFLNVVAYRLPRDQSLVKPPSACPACGRHIRFYDNIPLISWLLLGAKCRYCKAPISPRYFVIELLTGLVFTALFTVYFRTNLRTGIPSFLDGGWFIYLISLILSAALIAASAIDLQLWVIPVSICWFVTIVGLIGSTLGCYIIDPALIRGYALLPSTSTFLFKEATIASLAIGAAIGLVISWILLATGLIKRSYESENINHSSEQAFEASSEPPSANHESQINHRLEMSKEIIFLLPIIICSLAAFYIARKNPTIHTWWLNLTQYPAIAGLLGSLWGYFIGCGIVWITRILGTLGFGKEAMGLGDVHLMGAVGAVVGPTPVVVAFFIAPFLGLGWAGLRMFVKKSRQIPYGPFLSLAVFTVMIFHDRIFNRLIGLFYQ
ncbi:MAG: prepilin peptidase [Planctomycetota bacterium]|nr:MAG: prepilin peptidase [Planctomycetota bacterium]